jgi:methionyl-tRNA synthetase
MNKKMLVTAPIFYANSNPHIGSAHTMILCDFISRSFRLIGFDVFLSIGTDEHGDKILQAAKVCGKEPKEFVDEKHQEFKDLAIKLEIKYDRFIRTTDLDHIKAVQHLWKNLQDNGIIYKGIYKGYYSSRDESFFSFEELVEGNAPTGAPVVFLEEECFFISFKGIQEKLDKIYHSAFTLPENRINQIQDFIKDGLRDLCISRKGGWGISIPNDNRTIYVWFDALVNYLTVCGYPDLNEYWNNVIHVVGKDILTFHALYWPGILLLSNISTPQKVICHNWWIVNGEKMSKSLGNTIDPIKLIKDHGNIPLRLYCLKENLFHSDGHFDVKEMIGVYNNFFISKFCNLIHRVFSLAKKHSQIHKEKGAMYEESLRECILKYNSKEYFYTFFKVCDDLNREVDEKILWKNPHLCHEIVKKINSLIPFVYPLVPSFPDDIHENSKRFTPIIM